MATDLLWRSALAVIPLALIVAVLSRAMCCRASTRHAMWLIVLAVLVVAPVLPRVSVPRFAQNNQTETTNKDQPASKSAVDDERSWPRASDAHGDTPLAIAIERLTPPLLTPDQLQVALPTSPPTGIVKGSAPERILVDTRSSSTPMQRRSEMAPDSRVAPGDPPYGDPVLPATAQSQMPHIPGAPESVLLAHHTTIEEVASTAAPDDPQPTVTESFAVQWNHWVTELGLVRDAFLQIPPLPNFIWIGGIAILFLVAGSRIVASRRLIRNAKVAPPSVERLVAEASNQLNLRRAPQTLMTDAPISPMIWCGRRLRLVLPRGFWDQLDDTARRAVVYHELAHLKRRDHWICWIQLFATWLYWWHPVVWWIRGRLREEADLCCDAWVTAMLPAGRRAYAQALLDARRMTSVNEDALPGVGLGASTKRARRFARRLTMVMTERSTPRMSVAGLALAASLAITGCIVTPLWACPPDKNKPKPEKVRVRSVAVPAATRPERPTGEEPATTFERFMNDRDGDDFDEQMRQLERELEELKRELEKLYGGLEEPPAPPRPAAPPRAARPAAPNTRGYAVPRAASSSDEAPCEQVVARRYELPACQLSALSALMARDDVPVLISSPNDNYIEVHGNQAQHMIFGAFCKMISGEDQTESYTLSDGKMDALRELMALDTVPIIIRRETEQITVNGTDLEQAVFAAFVDMIDGGSGETAVRVSRAEAPAAIGRAGGYEKQARSQVNHQRELDGLRRNLERQAAQMAQQAERVYAQADQIESRADALADQAEGMIDAAEELDGPSREQAAWRAKQMLAHAEALEAQAESLEAQADALEEQADEIESQLDEVEDAIEDIEDAWEDDDDDDDD